MREWNTDDTQVLQNLFSILLTLLRTGGFSSCIRSNLVINEKEKISIPLPAGGNHTEFTEFSFSSQPKC